MPSDLAIETALSRRWLFGLLLRQTEGFLCSILTRMDVAWPCPDHTPLSRRHATMELRQPVRRTSRGPVALIVDSTGVKICGQGAWHRQKHGDKRRQRWKNSSSVS